MGEKKAGGKRKDEGGRGRYKDVSTLSYHRDVPQSGMREKKAGGGGDSVCKLYHTVRDVPASSEIDVAQMGAFDGEICDGVRRQPVAVAQYKMLQASARHLTRRRERREERRERERREMKRGKKGRGKKGEERREEERKEEERRGKKRRGKKRRGKKRRGKIKKEERE